jgi:hypothetical protein
MPINLWLSFKIEMDLRNADFYGGRKNRRTRRKTREPREKTNNKLDPGQSGES